MPLQARRLPCVVSDRIVYRTLVRGGLEKLIEVKRALPRVKAGLKRFCENVWNLVVRYQCVQVDVRVLECLEGEERLRYRQFLGEAQVVLDHPKAMQALTKTLPSKVRQFAKDLRFADDEAFFGGGGLNLRDEIEYVCMFIERYERRRRSNGRASRELEFADLKLRRRLDEFLARERASEKLGPNDGFQVSPGVVPRGFWWRYLCSGSA